MDDAAENSRRRRGLTLDGNVQNEEATKKEESVKKKEGNSPNSNEQPAAESVEHPLANSVDRTPSPQFFDANETAADTVNEESFKSVKETRDTDNPLNPENSNPNIPPVSSNASVETSIQSIPDTPSTNENVPNATPVGLPNNDKPGPHVAINVTTPFPDEFAISLSGCGFLGSYHFGVMICFRNNGKKLMSRVTRIAGASGGSLVAAVTAMCPDQLENSLARLYALADELNTLTFGALTPGFYLNERLSHIVDVFIPDDLSCIQNRLFVSLTRTKDKTNRIVSTYPNKAYLQKCLLASCFIPMYSMGYGAIPPEIDGDLYIDGGYTENLPVFKDGHTVTISPFSGSALICPHDQNLFEWKMSLGNQLLKVNMSNVVRGAQALFPPSRQTLHAYYEMGYRDGMKFLLNNGFLERPEGTPV